MRVLWPIASITFKEGIRNRAVLGISLFAVLLLGLSMFVSNMAPRDVGNVAVDMALSTISLSGLLVVLFVGINLVAKDLDRRTIYMVLSKPISRQEYIFGKFLGVALLVLVSVAVIGAAAAVSLAVLKAGFPDYFQRFSWPLVLLGIFFISLMLVLLTSASFLFSSFSSTSFITLVLTIITYIIGHSINDVKSLIEVPGSMEISGVTVKVVQAASYLFPNLSLFDIKTKVAHGIAIPADIIVWTVLYGIVYTALLITAASLLFRRKEFS